MAKESVKAKENNNLPAYTNIDNILCLLDAYKRKGNNEEAAKQVFGKSAWTYSMAKSALRFFGFINDDSCELLPLGRFVAYSQDEEKKEHIKNAIIKFMPYETFLINLFQKKTPTETTINEITDFWGRFNQGSTARNLEDAAKLFMSILEYLYFGKVKKGARGNETRIIWAKNAKQQIESALTVPNPEEINQQTNCDMPPSIENGELTEAMEQSAAQNDAKVLTEAKRDFEEPNKPQITFKSSMNPNITINVDMTLWSEEKIEKFFKFAYGKFGKE